MSAVPPDLLAQPGRSAASDPASDAPDALSSSSVTGLLLAWGAGERDGLDALVPAVYNELRLPGAREFRRESVGHTLQSTALIHEACLRLVDQRHARWQNRTQFSGVAAELMRRALIDHAGAKQAAKRGGDLQHVTFADGDRMDTPVDGPSAEVLELDEALTQLAVVDREIARLHQARYLGGLTIAYTGEVLGNSTATVKREWATARVASPRAVSMCRSRPNTSLGIER